MSTPTASQLRNIKSAPDLIVTVEAAQIKSKSTSSNPKVSQSAYSSTNAKHMNGSQSLHTTPIAKDEEDPHRLPPPLLIITTHSVNNIHDSHPKHHHTHRHSRHSKKHHNKLVNNTSRQAGHTPPPRISQHNLACFSDLVHDTDKKEGPINWWNLKVKMPDDNTMNILSPHRIPVPQTPTTPEYIVKTPDGLRISLLDVDIDDEKKLNELGIEMDDDKKEYILNLRKEQELAAEKEKMEQKEWEKLNMGSDNATDEDELLPTIIASPQIISVMSQPIYPELAMRPRKHKTSKTPHDPSTPTFLTYDGMGGVTDPYSSVMEWNNNNIDYGSFHNPHHTHALITPQTTTDITKNLRFDARVSLPLYKNTMVKTASAGAINMNNNGNIPKNKLVNTQSAKNPSKGNKRHSEVIFRKRKHRHKKRRKSRRKSGAENKLRRSHSVDAPGVAEGKVLKNRVNNRRKQRQRRSVQQFHNKKKLKRREHNTAPNSDKFMPVQASKHSVQTMGDLALGIGGHSHSGNKRGTHVHFKISAENENDTVDDVLERQGIFDIKVGTNVSEKNTPVSNGNDTPVSNESRDVFTPKPMEFNAPVIALPTINASAEEAVTKESAHKPDIQLQIQANTAVDEVVINAYSDEDEDNENEQQNDSALSEDENEDEYEDGSESEYSGTEDDSYEKYRLEDSSSHSSENPGPLNNPFAMPRANTIQNNTSDMGHNDEEYCDDDLPGMNDHSSQPIPSIAMPKKGNQLRLAGPAVFVNTGGNTSVVGNAGSNINARKNNKHMASSPLILQNQEAVSAFFSQYLPKYYANNIWLLSTDFRISQYRDLKNLNLFIYKHLRNLAKDETNHPTQPRNIKMKHDLEWDLKIDGIATCYITDVLMTNVITYTTFPKDFESLMNNLTSNSTDNRQSILSPSGKKCAKKHLLGIVKSTQSYTQPNSVSSPNTTQRVNANMTLSVMANSVTATPRASGVLRPQSVRSPQKMEVKIDELNDKLEYYENEVGLDGDDTHSNHNSLGNNSPLLAEDGIGIGMYEANGTCGKCCKCFSIHSLRSSLVFHGSDGKDSVMDSMIYTLCYCYGEMLLFLFIYFSVLILGVCERIYFPIIPYENQIELKGYSDYIIVISGRIMLLSFILMFISRMITFKEWLNGTNIKFLLVILDNFLNYKYMHLVLGWFGLIVPSVIHILFVCLKGLTNGKTFEINSAHNQYYIYSVYHKYDYEDTLYLYDLIRILLLIVSILLLILSNCGGTYYSHYAVSYQTINNAFCNKFKSILCNQTFDYGLNKKRYKLLHICAFMLYLFIFYLDLNYSGVYYILTFFVLCAGIDRLLFLNNKGKKIISTDLNIIPIDHQFKLLFVNVKNKLSKFEIEPGDIYYISSGHGKDLSVRPSIFFSKNNYKSIGCIMRVHRNNTLSNNMERVKWNFNFLEKILDNECVPVFRGPFRNNTIYNRLLRNTKSLKFANKKYIQYLIACDEGIAYQIEYLQWLQSQNHSKMPYPTHIIFATSSKSLFNYICTNLQLLFIEMEDLTVECKLLPSNINLIPNTAEMVQYYRNEKRKQFEKEEKNNYLPKKKQKSESEKRDIIEGITDAEVMHEMEYDILHYLSIPHILYHHNLKLHYENHKNSKLSQTLNQKYSFDPNKGQNNASKSTSPIMHGQNGYNFNEDIQIEMYYCGIPFVSNVLKNVCDICRIPYHTQIIY